MVSKAFDEMHAEDGSIRPPSERLEAFLADIPRTELQVKSQEADHLFRRLGITFLVYGEGSASERLIPFDILPRILSAAEWRRLEAGAVQRVKALNAFLHDIDHE